ncbi:similar to cytochrome P450 [Plenodomus lingam JN3]|uniref:Similar to cytochrome P450 n=2 Tax=Leptosphaeria maculans TaxID=5022 RepID=E5AEF0_LEPMJ|nr:similar to cytochrome P450 [Plenodomus lingam JN3]CBY01589.1 similar to cytochrome P450 [Plenodomus lingam JN3]
MPPIGKPAVLCSIVLAMTEQHVDSKPPLTGWGWMFAALVTYYSLATAYNYLRTPHLPTSIPWMGYGKGWIAGLRNYFALTRSQEWLRTGYERYSKENRMFVLPALLGIQAEIVMPQNQLRWMFDQPDSILNAKKAHYDFLWGDYSFLDPVILGDPYHEHVIHKNLVRNLHTIIPEMEEEVPFAVADVYGMDTENWRKIETLESFMKMVPVLTNRMLLGRPLCRERAFLDAALGFTEDIIRNQTILGLVPKALSGILGPLLGLTSKWHFRQSARFTLPMIKERIAAFEKQAAGDPEYANWTPPNDFITWSYRTAMAEGRLEEAQPVRLAQRLLPINFAAIHTTALTALDTMLGILSSDPSIIELLREEAYRIHQEEGSWTRQGLNRMHRLDSAIREAQRVTPIALTFVHRKVVAKEGIITPEGVHVPYGTLLSCPWAPLAQDEDLHTDAETFDAFRFSRPREEYEAMSEEEKAKVDTLKLKQMGAVTTAVTHLPFGHGRHACPGRFFVTQELKMIFAHLLLNYDFKPLPENPKRMCVVRFQVPLPAQIEYRRRTEAWTPEVKA